MEARTGLARSLVFALFVTTATAQELVVRVPIVLSDATKSPVATLQLGSAAAGKKFDIVARLYNATNNPIEFDSVATACSCTKASPERGRIAPDGTLDVRFGVQVHEKPNSLAGGGNIFFLNGGSPSLNLRFFYSFEKHAGIVANVAVVQWNRESGNEARFQVPILMGSRIRNSDLEITLTDIPAIPIFKIGDERRSLSVNLEFEDSAAPPLYGLLQMANLSTGEISSCRVIVEQATPVKVFPRLLRFVPLKVDDDDDEIDEQEYEASFFVTVPDSESPIETVYVQIADHTAKCFRQPSSAGAVSRFQLVVNSAVVSKKPAKCTISMRLEDQQVTLSVPCHFREVSK